MLLKKLKKEIEEGVSITKDALHEIHTLFPIKDLPEETVYFSIKQWEHLKSLLGREKKRDVLEKDLEEVESELSLKKPGDESVDKDYLYDSGLLGSSSKKKKGGDEKETEEKAKEREYQPHPEHPTDYSKKTGKVPPGFAFKSGFEVPIEPIEKKYKKKNPYRPED
jgi:hypothetical protein